MAQTVKGLPVMQETQVQSLGQEDLLEKEMATHSSILDWKIPWAEESGPLQFMGHKELDMTESRSLSLSLYYSLMVKIKQVKYLKNTKLH